MRRAVNIDQPTKPLVILFTNFDPFLFSTLQLNDHFCRSYYFSAGCRASSEPVLHQFLLTFSNFVDFEFLDLPPGFQYPGRATKFAHTYPCCAGHLVWNCIDLSPSSRVFHDQIQCIHFAYSSCKVGQKSDQISLVLDGSGLIS